MAQRARYFEFRAYRPRILDYFRAGARWTAAPKPLLADALYIENGPDATGNFDFMGTPLLAETEPVFDAACFVRCGRDIFLRLRSRLSIWRQLPLLHGRYPPGRNAAIVFSNPRRATGAGNISNRWASRLKGPISLSQHPV